MDETEVLAFTRLAESTAVNTFGLSQEPPVFTRGEGASLFDSSGRHYIDLVCGSAVTSYGYGAPWQIEAINQASATGVLHTGTRLPSPFRAEFYELLAALMPEPLSAVHLSNSGAEAMETAVKAAQLATGKSAVVSFYGAYHGRTAGALALTASRRAHEGFDVRPFNVHFFPYPNPDCPPLPARDPAELSTACLEVLDRALSNPVSGIRAGALVVEAVQGVSGVVVPPVGFIKGLREICDRHGLIMIVDEVWNGFGRCGTWFAFQRDGVVPDLVTFGKAASASLPLAGVVGRPELLKKWRPGAHTSTFQGNPIACAVASANIRYARRTDLNGRVLSTVEPWLKTIADSARRHAFVGATRVVGAQAGIDIVDFAGRPDGERLKAMQHRGIERGVLLYGGGWYGNTLMLVPPLTISNQEMRRAEEAIAETLETTQ
jgi:4-aminobutyrate aminotransferase-like enzyme